MLNLLDFDFTANKVEVSKIESRFFLSIGLSHPGDELSYAIYDVIRHGPTL